MHVFRRLRWLLGLCSTIVLWAPAVFGQCPPASVIEARLDSARWHPGEQATRLLLAMRQQILRDRCPRDTLFARIAMQLGYAAYVRGQADSAIVLFSESVQIFRRQPNRQIIRLVSALFYQGQAYQSQDSDAQAQVAYLTCVRMGAGRPEHDKMVGYALNGLSLLAYKKGDYEAGLSYAGQAIDRAQRCHDRQLEARCLNESARNLLQTRRYTQSLLCVDRAIAIIRTDPALANDLNMSELFRAEVLAGLGRYVSAFEQFRQVLTYYQQTRQPDRIAHVYGNMGDVYALMLNQPSTALICYRRAYGAFTDPYERSRMLQSIGNMQQRAGQHQLALTTFQRALLTLPIQFHNADLRADPDPKTIRLSAYKEYLLTLLWDKADTWVDYAAVTTDSASQRMRLKQALVTYQIADQMIDRMRWEQNGQQSKLYWRQQTRRLYEQALETCYRLGDREQALHFLEKSRAVLLADKVNELGASQLLSPKQQVAEQTLRQTVDQRLTDLARLTPDSPGYVQARTALLTAQEQIDTFVRQLEHSNPAYYRYRYDNGVPHLTELQRYLTQRQAAFISYFVGDSALYILSAQPNHTRLIRQPLTAYRQTVATYLTLLGHPDTLNRSFREFLRLSHQLYAGLLAPLKLPGGRVIVSPDGPFIPFETLSLSPERAAYALDTFAFSYAYSARLLLRQADPAISRGGNDVFLGVAPGRFAPGLKQLPLPGSEAALQTIGGGFRSPRLLLGRQATRRAFLEAAPSCRVLHLYTHATAAGEPRLFFADSTLTLSELSQTALRHAQLVTLAACQTGTGVDQQGEGVFSLARGFAALGIPSVLTTLWRVQNNATYQITTRFYQYLTEGLPKDVALQRARQDWMRAADGTDRLPSAWAGLILIGDSTPLDVSARTEWLGGLSGLLIGGLLQLGWRRWRRVGQVSIRPT